jgi:Domain of unknown function (DUF5122) beta-propeller
VNVVKRFVVRLLAALMTTCVAVSTTVEPSAAAANAVYDATFGSVAFPGFVLLPHQRAEALDFLADGSMAIGVNDLGLNFGGVIKIDSQGQVDANFGGIPGGFVSVGSGAAIRDIDVTGNSDIIVTQDARIFRLGPTGVVDPTFEIDATPQFPQFSHTSLDALGRLVVTGVDSSNQPFASRFTTSGALDATFASTEPVPGRLVLSEYPRHDPIMLPTGGFFLVGVTPAGPTAPQLAAEKITATGEFDGSFAGTGKLAYTRDTNLTNIGLGAAVDSAGRLVVIGNINGVTPEANHALILRFLSNGDPDTSFSAAADATAARFRFPRDVMMMPDGHILIVASYTAGGGEPTAAFTLNDDGTAPTAYGWSGGLASEVILSEIPTTFTLGAKLDQQGRPVIWGAQAFVARLRAPQPVTFVAEPPARLLDTRPGGSTFDGLFRAGGALTGGVVMELDVGGRAGVPASASAVSLNVTVTEPTAPGFLTVFPCGATPPNASNLNYVAGQTVPNAVITKLGDAGRVCLFSQVSTHVIIDVNGFYPAGAAFVPMTPARVLDSRPNGSTIDGKFMASGALAGGTTTELDIGGRADVPLSALAVSLNVTVTEPDGAGFLTVFPCGAAQPNASNLNYVTGQTVPNAVTAKLGANGRVCLFSQASTHVVVDINGYYPLGAAFVPMTPARLLDSRPDGATVDGQFVAGGLLGSGQVVALDIAGRADVPTSAAAVSLNVTVTGTTGAGFLTVFPCLTTLPNASNLNFVRDQTVPNAVITQLGSNGKVCVYSQTPTHVIVDINGYFP